LISCIDFFIFLNFFSNDTIQERVEQENLDSSVMPIV
jgi:hypothetical protein